MKKFLIIPLVFLSLASCEKERNSEHLPSEGRVGEEEVAALQAKLSVMERELRDERSLRLKDQSEQAEFMVEMRVLLSQKSDSQKPQSAPVLEAQISPRERDADARRVARMKGKGETFEKLVTVSGEEYRDLVISRVSDVGVVLRHQGGVARVPFTDLDEAWQERFYYDEGLAKVALRNERLARVCNDQAAAAGMVASEEKVQRARVTDNTNRLADLAKAVEQLDSRHQLGPATQRAQILVGPPIILTPPRSDRYPANEIYCPPVIRTPYLKVPRGRRQPLPHVRPVGTSVQRPLRPVSRPTQRPTAQPTARPTPIRPSTSRSR